MTRVWLGHWSWEAVTRLNHDLCARKNALHKPTSDGHEPAQLLWESKYPTPLSLPEAVELCRVCHKTAPFCFFNGNTFAAIAKDIVEDIALAPEQQLILQQLIGHVVAGTDEPGECEAFLKIISQLDS
jgi:hypothetical protein